ncbi:hypothetical protein WJX72_005503 [[Myrmecia] bisecta]|uniref:Uncharacterized protein n=1 Tax=[Myrmecia] bisecta TaxID=41462 RepID=A0AAW1PPE6_9CHLO
MQPSCPPRLDSAHATRRCLSTSSSLGEAATASSGSSVAGRPELPPYSVILKDGANEDGVRLRETQPLVMRYSLQGQKTMEQLVGSRRDGQAQERPPLPTAAGVSLEVAGGEVVAVLQFSGNATPEKAAALVKQLASGLQADGIALAEDESAGAFRVAQYGPVNSLRERLNELMLGVRL